MLQGDLLYMYFFASKQTDLLANSKTIASQIVKYA